MLLSTACWCVICVSVAHLTAHFHMPCICMLPVSALPYLMRPLHLCLPCSPLVLGKRAHPDGDEWCVASEDCAFGPIGFERVRDVAPGEMVVITPEGKLISRQCAQVRQGSKEPTWQQTLGKKSIRKKKHWNVTQVCTSNSRGVAGYHTGQSCLILYCSPLLQVNSLRCVHECFACMQNASLTPCIFEYIYLARPDTVMNGISVYEFQLKLGSSLAKRIK